VIRRRAALVDADLDAAGASGAQQRRAPFARTGRRADAAALLAESAPPPLRPASCAAAASRRARCRRDYIDGPTRRPGRRVRSASRGRSSVMRDGARTGPQRLAPRTGSAAASHASIGFDAVLPQVVRSRLRVREFCSGSGSLTVRGWPCTRAITPAPSCVCWPARSPPTSEVVGQRASIQSGAGSSARRALPVRQEARARARSSVRSARRAPHPGAQAVADTAPRAPGADTVLSSRRDGGATAQEQAATAATPRRIRPCSSTPAPPAARVESRAATAAGSTAS